MSTQKPKQPHQWTNAHGQVLILKRINKDRTAYNGFIYPQGVGSTVTCPDFNRNATCGGGIHGWPWGFGIGEGSDYDMLDDIWLVLSVKPEDVIGELEGGLKCKCKDPVICFEGKFKDAWATVASEQKKIIQQLASPDWANKSTDAASKLAASGERSKLAASGNASKLAASGNASKLAASGERSKLAASGYDSNLAASGDDSNLAASGYASKLAASGAASKLAASGDDSKLAASGDDSNLAASGYASNLAASGERSKLAASGYDSNLAASGDDSVCAIAANGGRVKVGKRGAFAIAYWVEGAGWRFATGKEGENGIKADVWYEVVDGTIVESWRQ